MVAFRLERKKVDEISQIKTLAEAIWLPYFEKFFGSNLSQRLFRGMYESEEFQSWLGLPKNHYFFIFQPDVGEPVGYLAYELNEDYLWIDKLYLKAEKRGSGLGGHLIAMLSDKAAIEGLDELRLRVYRHNKPAILFYQKNGFKIERAIDFQGAEGQIYPDYIMIRPVF